MNAQDQEQVAEQEYETQQIRVTKEQAEHSIKMGEAIERLRSNPDFKFIVEEVYFEQTALGGVYTLTNAELSTNVDAVERVIINKLKAIAHFRDFLNSALQAASEGKQLLRTYDEMEQEGELNGTEV